MRPKDDGGWHVSFSGQDISIKLAASIEIDIASFCQPFYCPLSYFCLGDDDALCLNYSYYNSVVLGGWKQEVKHCDGVTQLEAHFSGLYLFTFCHHLAP